MVDGRSPKYDILELVLLWSYQEAANVITTKISSKGQVVLPKSVRESIRWLPGTELAVELRDDTVCLKALNPFPPTTLKDVQGSIRHKGKRKSLADMDKGIVKMIRKRHASGRY